MEKIVEMRLMKNQVETEGLCWVRHVFMIRFNLIWKVKHAFVKKTLIAGLIDRKSQ